MTSTDTEFPAINPNDIQVNLIKSIPGLKRGYQRGVNRDLSQHQCEGLFERQTLALIDNLMAESDGLLNQAEQKTEKPWQELQARLQEHKNELVQYALHFNRTSCALSNFPDEHTPSSDYITSVLIQIETKWNQWSSQYW